MVKTKTTSGREVKSTPKKKNYDNELETKRIAAQRKRLKKNQISELKNFQISEDKSIFKGSELRKGVRAAEGIGYAGVSAAESLGRTGVSAVKSLGRTGVSAAQEVEREVESGLTGLERGLSGLTVNKVEDEMSELQKRITKFGGARTKRRRYKKRARSTKKR